MDAFAVGDRVKVTSNGGFGVVTETAIGSQGQEARVDLGSKDWTWYHAADLELAPHEFKVGQMVRVISTGEIGELRHVSDVNVPRPYCVRIGRVSPWVERGNIEHLPEAGPRVRFESLPRSEQVKYEMAADAAWAKQAHLAGARGMVLTAAEIRDAILASLPAIFPEEA